MPTRLDFKQGKASYRLDIIKQAGTLKDPLNWTVTYPLSYKVVSKGTQTGSQALTFQTDLLKDRSFEVQFEKP